MAKRTDAKKIFEALPEVNKIWLTDDGHFHLHAGNGGEPVLREGYVEPVKKEKDGDKGTGDKGTKNLSAKDTVELIKAAATPEEVDKIIEGDTRTTVLAAAEDKKAELAKATE